MTSMTTQFAKEFDKIEVWFFSGLTYSVDVGLVDEFLCNANQVGSCFEATGGYLLLDKKAKDIVQDELDEFDENTTLIQRLTMCCDIESFLLCGKDKKVRIYLQYDPLKDSFGNDKEYSNCPSFEIEADEKMKICFGDMSKQPKRVDNNYHELVKGWHDVFDQNPDSFCATFGGMTFFSSQQNGKNDCIKMKLKTEIETKTGVDPTFCFFGIVDLFQPPWGYGNGEYDIRMSKMANDKIFVSFGDDNLEFVCDEISVE